MKHEEGMAADLDRDALLEVVRNAPLVSIDLVVRDAAGRLLVGLRSNEPAKGTWFVPGGRIRKGETRAQALARISQYELGVTLACGDVHLLGAYDHLYETNFAQVAGISTHYVVLAYAVNAALDMAALPANQHCSWKWLEPADTDNVHPNTLAYLRD
jgi:colanic acid biosynthesis protein WcaH